MPSTMKIQPIDSPTDRESIRSDVSAKPVLKSRLRRLFDKPFTNVLRNSSAIEKQVASDANGYGGKDGEFDPSSVCLDKMVLNYIEESTNEKQSAQCLRNRCNCFNGNNNESSDDEFELSAGSFSDSAHGTLSADCSDTLKSLVPCASVAERNLLADISKIVEKNKVCKRKDELRNIVADGLLSLGLDASNCKSCWEKSLSYPAGEYEYIDVIVGGERILIDVDFRSEFEIARPTGNYKAAILSLPYIFVGKSDRLQQILSIVSDAASQSLKKRGMHIPPWRKLEYLRSKWFSPHTRASTVPPPASAPYQEPNNQPGSERVSASVESDFGDFDLIFGEEATSLETERIESGDGMVSPSPAAWQPPAIKPRIVGRGAKAVVPGLASLFKEKP